MDRQPCCSCSWSGSSCEPWGRVVKAIREDEDAARALGKNAYWYKLQALILGGVLGGMAGISSR
jgi:ABC-type branched-subunit amino acid transport system permease subunit